MDTPIDTHAVKKTSQRNGDMHSVLPSTTHAPERTGMADADIASKLSDERVSPPMSLFRAHQGLDRPMGGLEAGTCRRVMPGVYRWLPSEIDPTDLMTSFSFEDPALAASAGEDEQGSVKVRFGRTMDARHCVEVSLEPGTTVHGMGMQAASLDRSGRLYRCWNVDWPSYDENNPGLYQSHPWVFAVRADGTAFGVLVDTTWRSEIDLTDTSRISARFEGTPAAVYVLEADSPAVLCELLADVTGHMPMPARWTLGYQQCRWSYYPQGRALRIAEEFRTRQIPCDVIWFDIDYMQDFRIFSFNETHFPDPASLNERLHEMGFKTVWMIDPAPATNESDPVFRTGTEGEHFTLASDGKPFVGSVWAGPSSFPDYTRAETREWWAGLYKEFMATGIDGVWNDMNEPSVFDDRTKTMPESCWHRGGDGLSAGPHAMYHNVYGMLMVKASREGIQAANPEKRPFVLTRSNFIGGHRYAATWTGDNTANWRDLAMSVPMILSLSLSGQLFSGPDIGGFIDTTEGDPELFARWMGIGCLLPFARAHVARHCIDKEPWSFGEACEASCRRAIEQRYRLLPYLYTLAWRAHTNGAPIAQPAFFADPTDAKLRSEDRVFLLGESVLVECDVMPRGEKDPRGAKAMPAGAWSRFRVVEDDPALPVLRLKAGTAIPLGPVMQYSGEKPVDPLTIVAAPGPDGTAEGLLYEDAGDGYGFERGEFRLSRIVVETGGSTPTARLEHVDGEMPETRRDVRVELAERA